MGSIRSSCTDEFPNSTGGRINNEIIGVDTPVETGGNNVVVPAVVSDDSYVLVDGIEEDMSYEDDLVSITSSDSESEDDDSEDEYESEDEYDEELEKGLEERRMILADANNLKLLAKNFLHPEGKVVSNGNTGRCYFDRASAPEEMSKEEADELAMILADAKSLKTTAVNYLHPDETVDEVDPTVFGRNYFAAHDDEDAEERAAILAEAAMLKKHASDYLHPETKVQKADATLCGRNYFNRPDAPEVISNDEAEERAQIFADASIMKKEAASYAHPEAPITVDSTAFGRNYFTATSDIDENAEERAEILAEAAMLKKLASNYLHPESKVQNADAILFGCNYFDRADAPEVISNEEAEERMQILADAVKLKKQAVSYAHPEAPITVDSTAFGKNYFTASSDIDENAEERAEILAEAAMLKKLASNYLHPESKVQNADAISFGRNYFNRSDAPELISNEEAEERMQILADVSKLKKQAVSYAHPEAPITVDATAFGRNYFTATSEDEERATILAEAAMLKKLASDHLHPEAKVQKADATLFGRNFFNRPDAPEVISNDEAEERAQILADASLLKKEAISYAHPEVPITVDATAFGRNCFKATSEFDEEERVNILAEAAMFKKLASDYLHPEAKVQKADATLFGRNYFNRLDAPEVISNDEAEERAQILADVALLKKKVVSYAHPEVPIAVDSTVFGRNYFTATSDIDEDEEERANILAEAAMFKKLASDYLHPEAKVQKTDATLFGRNYFNRASAFEEMSKEEAEEHAQILADASMLKKEAVSYAHPEAPITVDSTACGRNYFTSSYDIDVDEERSNILAEAAMFKKLASDYLHPEAKVQKADAALFGRNYFNRASAFEEMSKDEAEERAQILADASMFKKEAVSYAHPEAPITVDSTACGRNYFTASHDIDVDEERANILAEAAMFKKLASDYLHPEAKVQKADAALFGRNYFNRASAFEEMSKEEAEERAQILADASVLKKEAVSYSHPEAPITTDSTTFGRNYFTATSDIDVDYEERANILAEAAMFKKLASDYLHPEAKVQKADATLFGRNYFNRSDAPEIISNKEAEECARILAEAASLKATVLGYSQPNKAIDHVDPALFGRNYFTAVSADTTSSADFYEERAQVLSEADALKKAAVDYAHPEVGVASSEPTAFARNFFHTTAVSDDAKISTYADDVSEAPVDDEESVDHHDELFEFDDYDQFTDMRQQLSNLNQPKKSLPHAASFADFAHSTIEIKGDDEEGHLSRSPSCVAFFNYF